MASSALARNIFALQREFPLTDFSVRSVDLADIFTGAPRRGSIPTITEPKFVPVDAARDIGPLGPVLSLVIDGDARELVLAADASGSVDAVEFELQLRAVALQDPDVVRAVAASGGVAVTLVQWSGPVNQIVAVDWALLEDGETSAAYARRIAAAGRQMSERCWTDIGGALEFLAQLIESNAFAGRRRVIDVSGDGETNFFGRAPGPVRDAGVAAGITINGLAILNEDPELDRYYDAHVIGGPGAFVMTADDYVDFARAMRRKFLWEIRGVAVAQRP